MNKKILVLADPTSIHTKKWIKGLEFLRYNVILSGLSNKVNNNNLIFNEHINSNGGNAFKYIKSIFKFYKVLKNEQPNITNTHYMSSYGLIGALIKRKKDVIVLSLHGSDVMIDMNKNFIYYFMSKFILNRTDILVSVSDTMTKRILLNFPHLEAKILTQQYGVDTNLLDTFYTQNKNIDIITNRQWKPNSNYPTILKALSNCEDRKLKLVGSDNSSYAKELLNPFDTLKSSSTGMIPYEKNLEYVAMSKIFISLTSSDGIPLSLIEAMYLGAIPIVSDIEPNKELIKDGINGFVISINSDSLQKIINMVMQLAERKINSIQEYNKRLVLEKFDFKKNFKKLENRLIDIDINKRINIG